MLFCRVWDSRLGEFGASRASWVSWVWGTGLLGLIKLEGLQFAWGLRCGMGSVHRTRLKFGMACAP